MSIPVRARQQTPRAGIYFGIFISVVGCLLALQLILAQLGSNATVLTLAAILLPVLVSVAVAIRFSTTDAYDYFVAGRSIPPLTNGLVVAITALGATGLVTITGLVFFVGFDGLAIPIGVLLGILVIATLIAPYARKDGAYTFAGYLGRRFESRFLRLLLGLTLALPCLLLLVAEFKVGLSVATQFLTISPQRVLLIGTVVVVATVVAGGLRGSTWGNGVAALLALIAITVPAAIVSLELTNIPIPQITHGMLVSELTRLETENGFAARPAAALAIEFPALGLERLVKPSMQMFATIGATRFPAADADHRVRSSGTADLGHAGWNRSQRVRGPQDVWLGGGDTRCHRPHPAGDRADGPFHSAARPAGTADRPDSALAGNTDNPLDRRFRDPVAAARHE